MGTMPAEESKDAILRLTPSGQLDLWSEKERGTPNAFLRSALFAAIQSDSRQTTQGWQPGTEEVVRGPAIISQEGYAIEYAGVQLNQYDLDVWLAAIHLVRSKPLETICTFLGSEFLQAIGRKDGLGQYEDLKNSLDRLTSGSVRITNGRYVFFGHLISNYILDKETKAFRVRFAEEILTLFGYGEWTKLYRQERQALQGKNLALWLHGYYASHAKPYPVTVEFLHKLSGSRAKAMRSFKAKLKEAFRELEAVTDIRATFDKDKIKVEHIPRNTPR